MSVDLDEGVVPAPSGRGPQLYHCAAMPSGGVKAMLGILHGYADHAGRYAHVMGALAEHGIGSVALDMRGHGRAGGPRGFCGRFDEFLEDAAQLTPLLDARAKSAPRFLLGHSFGGLVASHLMIAGAPYRGVVLSAPFFGLALSVPWPKLVAARIAARVYPKLTMPSGLSGKDLTHDPERARGYDTDPLVFKRASARWFTEANAAQRRALATAGSLKSPLYLAFGESDPVASIAVAKRFFDAAGSVDKTWDARPGLLHEILNEPSWKQLVEAIARWLIAHARDN